MSNTKAILSAQYAAEQMGKELSLHFWLREHNPAAAFYQLECAREHFAALVKHMGEIDQVVVEEPAATDEEVPF